MEDSVIDGNVQFNISVDIYDYCTESEDFLFLLCGPVFSNFSASVESLAVDLKFCQTT